MKYNNTAMLKTTTLIIIQLLINIIVIGFAMWGILLMIDNGDQHHGLLYFFIKNN